MTGTITTPPPLGPFGWGYQVVATTDTGTDYPNGFVSIYVTSTTVDPEQPYGRSNYPWSTIPRIFWRGPADTGFKIMEPRQGIQIGSPIRVVVEWWADESTMVDSISQEQRWEPQQGAAQLLERAVQQSGMSEVLKQEVSFTYQLSVYGWLRNVLPGLPDAIAQLPESVFGCVDPTGPLFGEGFLKRGTDPRGTNAAGLRWTIDSVPPGLGLDEGAPDQYEIGVLMLSTRRKDRDGELYYDATRAERGLSGSWWWGIDAPYDVAYYITPGVGVSFCWTTIL